MENSGNINLLVISYYFPPYDKVGGRRWAKHSKYMMKEGISFRVLAGQFEGHSPWDKDIASYSSRIERVKLTRKYHPYHLQTLPSNIFQKIKWKYSLYNWERKKIHIKENYNDVSCGNERSFLQKALEIIQKNSVNMIILSVGPFAYSSIIPELKKNFPHLKILIDYRDYWEDSFAGLTGEQKARELEMQKKVIDCVDAILSPNDEMQKHYAAAFNKPSIKLPHCTDLDDMKEIKKTDRKENAIRILYGGAFYSDIEENIRLVRELTEKLNTRQNTEVEFYVSLKGFENELKHPKIKRQGFIGTSEYFRKVIASDYVILILPPNRVNAMSSKFFELVSLRRPILYFGGKGQVSQFISEKKLGFHITEKNMDQLVEKIIDNIKNPGIPDTSFDIAPHTFEFQTKRLIEELQVLLN